MRTLRIDAGRGQGGAVVELRRPVLMGVLNVTPDSFSDGGVDLDGDAAVARGVAMLRAGAGILDVGAESTRPGAARVAPSEQLRRIGGVVGRLVREIDHGGYPAVVSVDTTRSEVADAALDQGARVINDVSAGRDDPRVLELAARRGAAVVLMHMLGQPATMQHAPVYQDVVREVREFLIDRAHAAREAGLAKDDVWIDPGIGFGKTLDHNLALLAALPELVDTGYPVVFGASRKRFISDVQQRAGRPGADVDQRLGGTCAATVLAALGGAAVVRVHDVTANRQALDVALAVAGAARY